MTVDSPDWIVLSFSVLNTIRLASFLPQLAVVRDNSGATAISLTCWTIWVGANGSTALYAWLRLGDLSLVAVSTVSCACCAVVPALAAYKRVRFFTTQRSCRPDFQTHWPVSPNAQAPRPDRIVNVAATS